MTPYRACDENGFALELDDARGKPTGKFVPVAANVCANTGTVPPDVDVRVLTDGAAVTHNGAHMGKTAWDLCWTAPAAGAGDDHRVSRRRRWQRRQRHRRRFPPTRSAMTSPRAPCRCPSSARRRRRRRPAAAMRPAVARSDRLARDRARARARAAAPARRGSSRCSRSSRSPAVRTSAHASARRSRSAR